MAGSIDYNKLLAKLDPQPGGEDTARMRTGIVDAVNANGTVDLAISGIVVPDVPRLEGSVAAVNTVVQVISYRGSLLVIGSVAPNNNADAGQMVAYVGNDTDSSAGVSGAETAILTITGVPIVSGTAYRVWAEFHCAPSVASIGSVRLREGVTVAGAMVREIYAEFPNPTGATAGNHFLLSSRWVAASTGTQSFTVTAQGTTPAATMRREGAANRLNEIWVERSL
jgi:hypothetical protein